MRKRRKRPQTNLCNSVFSHIYQSYCPGSVVAYLDKQGLIIRPCQTIKCRTVGTRVRIPARAIGPVAQLGRALETLSYKKNVSEAFNQGVVGSKENFFEINCFKEN